MDLQKQAEADLLLKQGRREAESGQLKEAAQFYQQALAIYREIGDRSEIANSLNHLGFAYKSIGQYQQAIEYYQQELTLRRELGDRRQEGYSLTNLGITYGSLGQYHKAIEP